MKRTAIVLVFAALAAMLSLVGVTASTSAAAADPVTGPAPSLKVISAGEEHTCAVSTEGAAMCWGNPNNGRLGVATGTDSRVPQQVVGLTSGVTAISAGTAHSCAVASGAVWCWGSGANGRLGNGSTSTSTVPVPVSGLTSGATDVEVGTSHSCAVVSGGVWCWGSNSSGQLGDGTTTASDVPVPVTGLGSGATSVSAGRTSSCAVVEGGARCWGGNGGYQLGDGTQTASSVPLQVPGLTSGVTDISTGVYNSCAVVSARAMCWGYGNALGAVANGRAPVEVIDLGSGVSAISVGTSHACAVVANGARCWGVDGQRSGVLGNGRAVSSTRPVPPVGLATGTTSISAGSSHSCAVASGAASCWGEWEVGELGSGWPGYTTTPKQVVGLTEGATAVALGSRHGCAVVSGSVRCWGDATDGQLGDGDVWWPQSTAGRDNPVPVVGLTSGATEVAAGSEHSCAVVSGAARCWGRDWEGQLGSSATSSASGIPVAVLGLTSGVTDISSAGRTTCAVVSGSARCWGTNDTGRLGNGTTTDSAVPVQVTGLTSGVTAIAQGGSHACAVVDGAAMCWGANADGELGTGTTTRSLVPVAVEGLGSGVTDIAVGNQHTCAVQSGELLCWGSNNAGQLGNGSVGADVSLPEPVDGLGSGEIGAIEVDGATTCAAVDGAARCWGANGWGNLGDGTTTYSSLPVAVSGLASEVTAFGGTLTSTCAVRSGGVQCWGVSTDGKTGDGVAYSPQAVAGALELPVPANTMPAAAAQTVTAPRGVGTQVVLSAADPEDDALTYAVVTPPTKGTLDCNGSAGEDCVYTARPGTSGPDSFTFKANDGSLDSNHARISITIANQAPTVDALSLSAPRGVATEVVLTASDPNGDALTFTKMSDPVKGTVSCTTAGICTYAAAPGASGLDLFTVRAYDGASFSPITSVTVTITNQAPTADDRALDAGRGIATPVVLSGTDPNGDPVTYEIVDGPTAGTLSCDPGDPSSCIYTSTSPTATADSFTYRSSDGSLTSAPATVAISIIDGPAANDQALEAPRGVATPLVLSASDGDETTTFSVVDPPAKGSVTCEGPAGADCTYTAAAGATGTDSFTFAAKTGGLTSEPGTVTVTITNQAPVANAQDVAANAPTTATAISLGATDPNGDPVTFEVVGAPDKGTLSCTPAGDCTYTAKVGATGTDAFTFRASDGFGGESAPATVSLALDATTPGVFVGTATKMEPESGNSPARGMVIPLTLSQPSPVPLTVWYRTADGTATEGADYTRFGTASTPRSVTFAAGTTWATIAPPVRDDALREGVETFQIQVLSVTGGPAYLAPSVVEATILDADSLERSDASAPILSVTSIRQAEGNAATPTARKAQVRLELSKPLTAPLTVRWSTVGGTAVAGTDFKARSNVAATIQPGQTEVSLDLSLFADDLPQSDRSFAVEIASVTGGQVVVDDPTGTITILDEDH